MNAKDDDPAEDSADIQIDLESEPSLELRSTDVVVVDSGLEFRITGRISEVEEGVLERLKRKNLEPTTISFWITDR